VFNFSCKICDCTDQEIKTTDYQTFVKCVQCGYVTVFDNEDIEASPELCKECETELYSESLDDENYLLICPTCNTSKVISLNV